MNKLLSLSLLFALACGGSTVEPVSAVDEATSETDLSTVEIVDVNVGPWVVAAFSLTDQTGSQVTVDADGALQVSGQSGEQSPQFFADGRVEVGGELVAMMSSDGTLRRANGAVIATVGEDGSTTVGDQSLSFAQDGSLVGGNPDQPMTLSPADSPAKRLAMSALLLMMTIDEAE